MLIFDMSLRHSSSQSFKLALILLLLENQFQAWQCYCLCWLRKGLTIFQRLLTSLLLFYYYWSLITLNKFIWCSFGRSTRRSGLILQYISLFQIRRLLALQEETGYDIMQKQGQRIFGGPPPGWTGPPPGRGTEIYCYRIPRYVSSEP